MSPTFAQVEEKRTVTELWPVVVSVCWAGLLIDPNYISRRGRDFPAELFGHRGAPDFSVFAHKSIDVHICVY